LALSFIRASSQWDEIVDAQRQLGRFRHAVFRPRRIERQLQLTLATPATVRARRLHFGRQRARHRAIGRSESHEDARVAGVIHVERIDQPELVDVDRHLRS